MKAVQTMAATAPGPRHKPRRTGRAAELLWPPKARDVEHGLQRGVRLLPGLNRLLALGVMAASVMVVHRSDSSVRMQYGRVRKFVRCSGGLRAGARYAVCSAVWGFLGRDASNPS